VDIFRGLRRGGLAYSAAFANPQFVTPLFTGKNRSFLDHFCPQAKQAKGGVKVFNFDQL